MQISLAGKVAIVTGVSGDGQVGQAVARALAENGAQLAICAREQSNIDARAKELRLSLLSPRQWPVAAVWPHDVRFGRSALIAAQCRTMRGSVGA